MRKESNEATLGQRIRAQRIRLGMTQEKLAEALFVEKSAISYYENDKKEMRAGSLAAMARALKTTPNYLLGYIDKNNDFLSEVLPLLEGINDETVKKVLLAQIKAVCAL